MSALGELIVFMIYAVLGMAAITCLLKIIVSKATWAKFLYFLGFVSSATLFLLYFNYKANAHRTFELKYVGTYYLTEYPNCQSCKAILKEDNTYQVMKGKTIIEKGNWHYESGGDYFIVYLDNNKEQLGSGRFLYDLSKNGFDSNE